MKKEYLQLPHFLSFITYSKKKHLLFIALIFICAHNSIFSQNYNSQIINPVPEKIFSASPDVMAFQKYNITDVNLYTGKVDVTIPIFEIKSGNINVPISLNYDSSGIKVDDRATSVGLGWVLNAGGNIIRIINDVPDNEVTVATNYETNWDTGTHIYPYIKTQGYNRKKNGTIPLFSTYFRYSNFPGDSPVFLYREDPNETEINGENGHYWSGDWALLQNNDPSVEADIPDTFIVNAPGLSSKFITTNNTQVDIYPNNNSGFTTRFLDNSGIKMSSLLVDKRDNPGYGFYNYVDLGESNLSLINANGYHQGAAVKKIKDFYEFNVTNTNGVKYKFNEEEVNETFYRPFGTIPVPTGSCIGIDIINSYHANYYNKRIHTWNLSKIEDDKTNKAVDFVYETYGNPNVENNLLIDTPVNLTISSPQNENLLNKCILTPYLATDPYNYLKMTSMTKNPKRKRLTSISYDEGTIVFQYGLSRQDYLGENALTEIIVKNKQNTIIKRFVLSYSYFDSKENCSDPDCKRLKLENVKVFGNDSKSNTYALDYEYTNKLPKRGSLEHDFLGFYNNNGATNASNTLLTPTLYFYKNNYTNSTLPFPLVNNSSFQTIPGNFSLLPNSFSLTGLLKKITYPTGGSSEFEYENNQFQYLGENYVSGGARIKSQKLTDNNNVAKKINYSYLDQNGKSSGYINNIPKFANIIDFYVDTMVAKSFSVYDTAKGGIELTSGSFVGYSKITETEVNNGYTKYEFSSPGEFPNTPEIRSEYGSTESNCTTCGCLFIKNSAYPMLTYIDNENRRGKLTKKSIYNTNNQILDEEINEYSYRVLYTLPISTGVAAFYKAYYTGCTIDVPNEYGFVITSSLLASQNLLIKKTNSKYFNSNIVSTITDFQYDSNLPFVTNEYYNNGLSNIEIRKTYPYFSSEFSAQPVLNTLITKNRIDEVVTEKVFRDNVLIDTKQVNYSDFGNGLILPKSISAAVGAQVLEEQSIVDLRDNKGNILQYHDKSGVNSAIIWGYNQVQPIAKIDNAAYSQVLSYVSNLQSISNTGTDASLIAALSTLRSAFPNAMVTTYTYAPLVGVKTITDPKGLITYYEYDGSNRLQYIKDQNLNVLQRYCYNYLGQLTDCSVGTATVTTYKNVLRSATFTKQSCGTGLTGSTHVYSVPAGTYISTISQANADAQADSEIAANGQNFANANGTCMFANIVKSGSFTKNNCAAGGVGSVVVYTVPAGRYTSTTQAAADALAQTDVDTNGQTYANTNGNGTCTFNSIAKSGSFTKNNCAAGGVGSVVVYTVPAGRYTSTASQAAADALAQTDVDTNGQANANTNGICTFSSIVKSGSFTRNNCAAGGVASSVAFSQVAGAQTSTVSQADADSKGLTLFNTNGQANANTNGTCTFSSIAQSGSFVKNNCGAGGVGSSVAFSQVVGAQTSTISQADADSKGLTLFNTNGQANANTNGSCTFSSIARSGSFTRNNCAAGGVASSVAFSQAVGAQTSTISQADADSKGLTLFNTNGQANANTNGTCTFSSAAISGSFVKNNCITGQYAPSVSYSQAYGAATSTISQADADSKGQTKFNTDGQANANTNGICYFKSIAMNGPFKRNNCAAGLVGTNATYWQGEGAATSTISQADADSKGLTLFNTNGQANANVNGICIVEFTYEPFFNASTKKLTIDVMASSTSHNGATFTFNINFIRTSGAAASQTQTIVFPAGQADLLTTISLLASSLVSVDLVSVVRN